MNDLCVRWVWDSIYLSTFLLSLYHLARSLFKYPSRHLTYILSNQPSFLVRSSYLPYPLAPLPTNLSALFCSSFILIVGNFIASLASDGGGGGINPISTMNAKYAPMISGVISTRVSFFPAALFVELLSSSLLLLTRESTACAFLSSRFLELVSEGRSAVTQSKSGRRACGSRSRSTVEKEEGVETYCSRAARQAV